MKVRNRKRRGKRKSVRPANARVSPLRVDPTRTGLLRRRFTSELRKRFARLRFEVVKLIRDEDSLGLAPRPGLFSTFNAASTITTNDRWRFATDPEKVKLFEAWLRQQVGGLLTGQTEEQLWARFVEEGFRKGAGRAFDDTKRAERALAIGDDEKTAAVAADKEAFLRQAFGQPVAVEKVKLLAGRVFTELKGVTEAMAVTMARTLADGLARGASPHEVARELAAATGISRGRAETIARTETIRAHAEGQLQALEDLGVEDVGVAVEWLVTDDEKLCPKCAAMAGTVFKLSEARGLIPYHPNCRCAFTPAFLDVGAPVTNRSWRGRVKVIGAGQGVVNHAVPQPSLPPLPPNYPPDILAFSRWLSDSLADNASYFADCQRDERGRCTSGGGGAAKPTLVPPTSAAPQKAIASYGHKAERPKDGVFDDPRRVAVEAKVAGLVAKLGADKGVSQTFQPGDAHDNSTNLWHGDKMVALVSTSPSGKVKVSKNGGGTVTIPPHLDDDETEYRIRAVLGFKVKPEQKAKYGKPKDWRIRDAAADRS